MTAPSDSLPTLAHALQAQDVTGLSVRDLAAGDVLVERGEHGGDAYLVESGQLSVLAEDGSVLTTESAGALLGEFVALVGGERTATVRAEEQTRVRVVPAAVLETVLAADPALNDAVKAEAVRRIAQTQLHSVLIHLLGPRAASVAPDLAARGTLRRLEAGDVLFEEGESADSAFVVVSGRLRRRDLLDGQEALGFVSAGSLAGEEGLVGGQRRRVSIDAVRDSAVLEVPASAFQDLLVAHPRELAPLALRVAGGGVGAGRDLDRTIAVAVTTHLSGSPTAARLADRLQHLGSVVHLDATRVDGLLDRPGIADSHRDPGEIRLLELMERVEHESCFVVLEPDERDSAWSRRVLRQSDVLAVVASADPTEAEQARVDVLLASAGPRTLRVLVLVHHADAHRARGTAALVGRWAVDHVAHVRNGSSTDLDRVARLLAGRPVALVLGGGGAKGFASLGVFRALTELGVPVDAVGATSIGAPLGAVIAQGGQTPDEMVDEAERLFHNILDYTLPLVSVMKGERALRSIREQFEGWDIEDLWLPFFCISTNLTQGRAEVHRRGDIVTAVRASTAIPGAFPPVPFGDDLLVDGGVTNNLPVDVMRRLYPTADIVAVEVAPARGPRAKTDYGLSVSGWKAMKSKMGRGPNYPGLVAVLMRSMITGSMDHRDAIVAGGVADLLLDMDMRGVGLLDFERVREVAQAGYEQALPRLTEWLDRRCDDDDPVPGTEAATAAPSTSAVTVPG